MRTLVWVAAGALAVAVVTALAARLAPGHVMPEMAVVVVVFVALRRGPVVAVTVAVALGGIMGRQALAPAGLHPLALALTGLGVALAAGSLSAGGALFFATACGAAAMAFHALLFLLLAWQRGPTGFASLACAALLPTGLTTLAAAAVTHRPLAWLDRRLTRPAPVGLSWR